MTDEKTIQEQFVRFHNQNPWIYQRFYMYAKQAHESGLRRIGAKFIMERIRWDNKVLSIGDEFKVNNNYTSRYARMLVFNHPELESLFEFRRCKSA